jgi:hypothetical protein
VAVEKFRTIEEMNDAPVMARGGDGFERFLRHCARYWAIAPRIYPRGVFTFRTVEQAQEARARHRAPADAAGRSQSDGGES